MGKVICVANQKGGVGKTTTCFNLGIALVKEGYKVCLIDLDPRGSLTQSLGYRNPDELECTMADVLRAEIEFCDNLSRGYESAYGEEAAGSANQSRQFALALALYGMEKKYTLDQLRHRRRDLMKKNHPDEGGATDLAQEINMAYDILARHAAAG